MVDEWHNAECCRYLCSYWIDDVINENYKTKKGILKMNVNIQKVEMKEMLDAVVTRIDNLENLMVGNGLMTMNDFNRDILKPIIVGFEDMEKNLIGIGSDTGDTLKDMKETYGDSGLEMMKFAMMLNRLKDN